MRCCFRPLAYHTPSPSTERGRTAKIFRPGRGSDKRRFDQAAYAYTQGRAEIRKLTLRADTLEAMRKEIDNFTSRLDSLQKTRKAGAAEHARLTRLHTKAPQLRSHRFRSNEVRLLLILIAYNLGKL